MKLDKNGNLTVSGSITVSGGVSVKGDAAVEKSVRVGDYQIQQDKEKRLHFGRKLGKADVPLVTFPKDESEPAMFRGTGLYYTNKKWAGNKHKIDNSEYNQYVYNVFKQAGYKENPIYMGGTDWHNDGQNMTIASVRNHIATQSGGNQPNKNEFSAIQVQLHGHRPFCPTNCMYMDGDDVRFNWDQGKLKD